MHAVNGTAGEICRMGAAELARAIGDREISSAEVVSACLQRHDDIDETIGAVPSLLAKQALSRARKADAALRSGARWGPLHGVPVVVKANVDVTGQANTHGVSLLSGNIAQENSPVVDNLLNAGAVLLGLSNTSEFGLRWHTESDAFGRTLNPWDPELTPGGSSGGSAAAVATGLCPLAHGNDFGGSLRFPAQCCGVAAIRPSLGRVPHFNATAGDEAILAVQLMAVQGPIARSIEDLQLGLRVMAGKDARDPFWVPAPFSQEGRDRPLKIAVTSDPGDEGDVDAHTRSGIRKAACLLEYQGCIVDFVDPPEVSAAHDLYALIVVNEIRHRFAQELRPILRNSALGAFENLLANVPEVGPSQILTGLSERTRFMREWSAFFERHDLILAPVTTRKPFRVGDDAADANRHGEIFRSMRALTACNLMGLPAVAVPVGAEQGLPQAVQLIGRWFCEDTCLDAARIIEWAVGTVKPTEPVSRSQHETSEADTAATDTSMPIRP